jgi:hypothetical protein
MYYTLYTAGKIILLRQECSPISDRKGGGDAHNFFSGKFGLAGSKMSSNIPKGLWKTQQFHVKEEIINVNFKGAYHFRVSGLHRRRS